MLTYNVESEQLSIYQSVVTLIEVIEHVYLDELDILIDNVFRVLSPELVIMTTPNKDFNKFFGMAESEVRNHDHKFEFTRAEFYQFCQTITEKYPDYSCSYDGIVYNSTRHILEEYYDEYLNEFVTLVASFKKSPQSALKENFEEAIENKYEKYSSCDYRNHIQIQKKPTTRRQISFNKHHYSYESENFEDDSDPSY